MPTNNPTPEERAAWRVLCEKAQPAPWHVYDRGIGWEVHAGESCGPKCDRSINDEFRDTMREDDARFIVAARNNFRTLIDALEAAEREREQREVVVAGYTQGLLEKDEEIEKLRADLATERAERLHEQSCHDAFAKNIRAMHPKEIATERTGRESAELRITELEAGLVSIKESVKQGIESLKRHDAHLTEPLERRVGELLQVIEKVRKIAASTDDEDFGLQQIESICRECLASTPREGTEEPKS